MNAKDIIECNACHVCDGELYEGWRVGCDDLIFRVGAEEAVKVKEEEIKIKGYRSLYRKLRIQIRLVLRLCRSSWSYTG